MGAKTIIGLFIAAAGVGTAAYFGYRFAKDEGIISGIEESSIMFSDGINPDHNARLAANYYQRQAEMYNEQRMLKALGRI